MSTNKRLNKINEERELLNFEYTHLYNIVKHSGMSKHLLPRIRPVKKKEDKSEYGLMVVDRNGKRRTWRFPSFEKCLEKQEIWAGSIIVRLGRDFKPGTNFTQKAYGSEDKSTISFLASADESGNIETPESDREVGQSIQQLVSLDLMTMGFIKGSGCRPSAKILRDLSMRYNDIVPEEFAAAVVRHCEKPRPDGGNDSYAGKSPWRTPEAKQAWYDTPAGKVWVKENPTPRIFALPTPEIIRHRRDTHDQ